MSLLCQYMSCATFLKALTREGFWVKASFPADFDDPYECTGLIKGTPSARLIQQFKELRKEDFDVRSSIKEMCDVNYFPGLDSWEHKTDSDIVLCWLRKALQDRTFLARGYRVSCFCSDEHDEELMWAFYGDKSKGIRIVFDLNGMDIPIEKVRYVSAPPLLDLKDVNDMNADMKPFFDACIVHKHESWSYQKEIRAVFQGQERNRYGLEFCEDRNMWRWLVPFENILHIDIGCEVEEMSIVKGEIAKHIKECGGRFDLLRFTVRDFQTYGFKVKPAEIPMKLTSAYIGPLISFGQEEKC